MGNRFGLVWRERLCTATTRPEVGPFRAEWWQIVEIEHTFLNDLQAERELSHVRVYNPRIFMPTHHDGSCHGLWRSTEPIFQSIKESVTYARS